MTRAVAPILILVLAAVGCRGTGDVAWSPLSGPNQGGDENSGGDGHGPVDNVALCESWLDRLECRPDEATLVDCDALGEHEGDLTAYFDCLEDTTECVEGMVDPTGWAECTPLLSPADVEGLEDVGPGPDRSGEEACMELVLALVHSGCEGVDQVVGLLDCETYDDPTCDAAPYFECLAESVRCDETGAVDLTAMDECAELDTGCGF